MRFKLAHLWLLAFAACAGSSPASESPETKAPASAPAHSCESPAASLAAWTLSDAFCRNLAAAGVTLVDWDGYLANPAIAITVTPPQGLGYPLTLGLTTDEPRIYFDRGSRDQDAQDPHSQPAANYTFLDASPVVFRIAIWPDRDGENETHTLHLAGGGVSTDVPIQVIDQDLNSAVTYPINVDFSQDPALGDGTHFFDDPEKQAVVVQAANDWAYFLDGSALDVVPAGQEMTEVDGASGWYGPRPLVANTQVYTGFLLYALGIHTSEIRSTGFPASSATYESSAGQILPGDLHRSGALEIEQQGNYGDTGWYVSSSDETWYLYDNFNGPTDPALVDLASIVHHEMGHALFFCGAPACPGPGYQNFPSGTGDDTDLAAPNYDGSTWGTLTSPEIQAYYPDALLAPGEGPGIIPIDFRNHFAKISNAGALDPASGLGAFGNEYADDGVMPVRRWIITKLDLLAAKAVGYPLRMSLSPFVPPSITNTVSAKGIVILAPASVGNSYSDALVGNGGVPAYNWTLTEGELPPGLSLDSFDGTIAGVPTVAGKYAFSLALEDSLGASTSPSKVQITIQ